MAALQVALPLHLVPHWLPSLAHVGRPAAASFGRSESALTQSISQVAPWTIPTYWSMASLLGEPGTPTSAGQHLASPHRDIDGTVAGSGVPGTHLNFKVSR